MNRSAFLVTLACLCVAASARADDDANETLRMVEKAYTQNRESFEFLDTECILEEGKAESIEAAIAGKWKSVDFRRIARWTFDGDNEKYTFTADPRETAANEEAIRKDIEASRKGVRGKVDENGFGTLTLPARCSDRVFLRRDGYSLKSGSLIQSANLLHDVSDGEGIRTTPFNMDVFGPDERSSPGRYIRDSLRGRWPCDLERERTINGVKLIVASVRCSTTTDGKTCGPVFGFDPTRGYLPAYASLAFPRTGEVVFEVHMTQARQFPDGRWMPMELVKVHAPGRAAPFRVERLRVENVEVEKRPDADLFVTNIRAGVQISAPGKQQWLTLKADEQFRPEDLPSIEQRMIENVKKYRQVK
jgi:hypothetical protein